METKAELRARLAKIEKENVKLLNILNGTLWMAQRYAHGRSSYATATFNDALQQANELSDGMFRDVPYVDDGMFGTWNPELRRFNLDKETNDEQK